MSDSDDSDSDSDASQIPPTVPAVIVRGANGRFLPGTTSPHPITRDNARDMHAARAAKTARLIRAELSKRTAGASPSLAVAMAAGDLWDQIVSNPEANARYRLETWRGVAGAAELLADRRADTTSGGVNIEIGADLAREIVSKLLNKD